MRRNADDGECGWAARSGVVDKTRGLEERCERNRYSPSTISRCLAESQTCRENPKYEGKRSQRPLVCISCTIQGIRGGQAAICSFSSFLFVRWHGRYLLPARWSAPTIYRVSPKKFPLKFIYSWSKIQAWSPCLMRKIMISMDPANNDDQSAPGQIIIFLIPHREYERILDQV